MKAFNILATSLLGISGGGYSIYEILRSKNIGDYLKWKGYSLINSDNSWEAIYQENSSDFSSVKELRNYCSKVLASSNFDKLASAIKYCIDKPITVRGELIKEGLIDKLISTEDEYKTAFVLRSGNEEFLDLISNSLEGYKEWCESSLDENTNFALLANVKTFCIAKPYKTGDEKLKNEGLVRLSEEELKNKFDELGIRGLGKNDEHSLLVDIADKSEWDTLKRDQNKFAEAFWNYCEKEGNRAIFEEGYYPSGYSKFRSRCANIEPLKVIQRKQEEIKNNPLVREIANIEKENKCRIYFVHQQNQHFKADDLIWLEIQSQKEFSHRNLYQEFKDFVASDKGRKLCKEANGKKVYVEYGYWTERWGKV